jgi:hypothetical protein
MKVGAHLLPSEKKKKEEKKEKRRKKKKKKKRKVNDGSIPEPKASQNNSRWKHLRAKSVSK